MHTRIFTVAITFASRMLIWRDQLLGRTSPVRMGNHPDALVSRHSIASGSNTLDAIYVEPADGPAQAVVLICHGIGEVVERWFPVQKLLAGNGAASLVFDYSGYGRSTGSISARQSEQDAIAAFEHLRGLAPGRPVSVVGFSLGSGIAAAVISRIPAERLVLCAGFTSFRAAAHRTGVPKWLAAAVPDIWNAEESLQGNSLPVLVVHGEKDQLFPVRMAQELAACCGPDVELIVVPDLRHNQPFYRPQLEYWGLILSRLTPQEHDAPSHS